MKEGQKTIHFVYNTLRTLTMPILKLRVARVDAIFVKMRDLEKFEYMQLRQWKIVDNFLTDVILRKKAMKRLTRFYFIVSNLTIVSSFY